MALIRCPKHGIPYNEANPRGCPACAQEKDGGDASVMKELARVSQVRSKPVETATPPPTAPKARESSARQATLKELFDGTAATIRETPEIETTGTRARKLWGRIGEGKITRLGIPALLVLVVAFWWLNSPKFDEMVSPVRMATTLPFPVEPGTAIPVVFSVLGTQPPREHPEDRRLERYQYGTDLAVDGLNGFVYSISFSVGNRSWQGLSVGLDEDEVRGALARLGDPTELDGPAPAAPTVRGEYLTYPSLDSRPLRRLQAEVRPPNGCYDVIVNLRYRTIGVLQHRGDRLIVVGTDAEPPHWTSTRITVIDRSRRDASGNPPSC